MASLEMTDSLNMSELVVNQTVMQGGIGDDRLREGTGKVCIR